MRALMLAVGAALTLSACGGGGEGEENSIDTLSANTLIVDDAGGMDANMVMDGNMALDANMMGGMDPANATAQDMMQQDLTTNDADANLANGL